MSKQTSTTERREKMEQTMEYPSVTSLKEALVLSEERERVQALASKIDSRLKDIFAGRSNGHAEEGEVRLPRNRRGRRGILKQAIMTQLQRAGERGVTVADLAKQLKTDPKNISAWFTLTGKKNSAIKRVRPGHYRLQGGAA